jgi:hypothetical protein
MDEDLDVWFVPAAAARLVIGNQAEKLALAAAVRERLLGL